MKRNRILLLVVLSILLVLGLAGAAGASAPEDLAPGFNLALGESRHFPAAGMTILFAAVTEDTRPGGQGTLGPAGAVTVRMIVSYDYLRVIQTIDLRLVDGGPAPTAALANNYRLTLEWVSPRPDSGPSEGLVPAPSEYKATFSLAGPAPDLSRSIFGAR